MRDDILEDEMLSIHLDDDFIIVSTSAGVTYIIA